MEKLLAAIIVAFLMVGLPMLLTGGMKMLNILLWLKLNYPNREKWPKDAFEVVYVPQHVAFGVHPLLTILGGVLATGLLLWAVGAGAEIEALQAFGKILAVIPGAMFAVFLIGIMWANSGGQGEPSPVAQRTAKAFQSLTDKINEDNPDDMQPLYRLWHTFYSHDNLRARFVTDSAKHRRAFKGLILPKEVADEIEHDVQRLREEYRAASMSDRVPDKIKKIAERHSQSLDSLLKFKTTESSQ